MSRVIYKGKFFKINIKKKKNFIFNKSLTILPEYINCFFNVYNGKKFMILKIKNEMIGYKFGEFLYTRQKHIYKKKIKNGSKNNTNKFKIK